MKTESLVSVGMPIYNRPEPMRRAINSILNQTYKNLEIIISNDFSPNPEIYKILDEFAAKDSRIKLTHQIVDFGCYGNYYWVLQQATGKYFMYAQDDDVWEPEFVEEMVTILEAHPDYIVAISAVRYIGEDNSVYAIYTFENETPLSLMISEKLPFLWMGLWKREELILFDKDGFAVYGKDIVIVAEALFSRKWGYTNKILYDKKLYYDKAFKSVQQYPTCLLQMYNYLIMRMMHSEYISDENKLKICVVLPLVFARIVLSYASCFTYLLIPSQFRSKALIAYNRLCIHD